VAAGRTPGRERGSRQRGACGPTSPTSPGSPGRCWSGDAPGIDALRPRADFAPDRIGWAWLSRPDPVTGRTVVWHNGGTGGFTSFLGVDRQAGVAVVVLSAVGAPDETTPAGFALLRRLGGAR